MEQQATLSWLQWLRWDQEDRNRDTVQDNEACEHKVFTQKMKELHSAFVAAYNAPKDQKRRSFSITAEQLSTFMQHIQIAPSNLDYLSMLQSCCAFWASRSFSKLTVMQAATNKVAWNMDG